MIDVGNASHERDVSHRSHGRRGSVRRHESNVSHLSHMGIVSYVTYVSVVSYVCNVIARMAFEEATDVYTSQRPHVVGGNRGLPPQEHGMLELVSDWRRWRSFFLGSGSRCPPSHGTFV